MKRCTPTSMPCPRVSWPDTGSCWNPNAPTANHVNRWASARLARSSGCARYTTDPPTSPTARCLGIGKVISSSAAPARPPAATLVERTTRFTAILGLPLGKDSTGLADALIEHTTVLPALFRKSLTWDQGSEMARHAHLSKVTDLDVYFADPHSPWQRGTNENTNRRIRRYLPKGTDITDHQPYLNAIAEELNEMPMKCLNWFTPREAYERLLTSDVATTA
jgi:hypothetical protein